MIGHNIASRGLADFDLYPFNPSAVGGYTFVVLFGAAALVHFIYIFSLRAWSFIPFVLGCIGKTVH
jgi:hypothetical protein